MFRKRAVIYPKDVVCLTGRSERYAQILLHQVRAFVNKEPHQFVTVSDFPSSRVFPKTSSATTCSK